MSEQLKLLAATHGIDLGDIDLAAPGMGAINWASIIAELKVLVAEGVTNLPAIIAALAAAGIVIPPQFQAILAIILAFIPKPAPVVPTAAPTA